MRAGQWAVAGCQGDRLEHRPRHAVRHPRAGRHRADRGSYLDVRREMRKPPMYPDVNRIRKLIGEYMGGDEVWRFYLGVGLTPLSVFLGAGSSVLGSLAQ